MTTFTSVEALKSEILMHTRVAVFNAREEIYGIIHKCLQRYYGEYEPSSYIRTEQLLRSLVRVSDGDGLGFRVYFDSTMLNYENGVMELKHTPESGIYGWATWDADKVLNTAMHGSHGGYVEGTAIWDESMAEIGSIIMMIKRELIKAGLPVK